MDTLEKKYYKISEVAEIVGIPQSTLRFWEKEFPSVKPKRNTHGSRFYTPSDIEQIRMIHYLVKTKGMKLDAAKAQLKVNRNGVSKKYEAIARLQSIRDRLQQMLDGLNNRKV